jgi:hypothetical protein
VTKVDDNSLDPEQLCAVEERARRLLDRASAWGVYPTPIDDVLAAAKLKVAPTSIFDLEGIAAYLKGKAIDADHQLKSAVSKIIGLYDAGDSIIHIDSDVGATKQNFLKLHETGHHELPTHRKLFKFFQDCNHTPFAGNRRPVRARGEQLCPLRAVSRRRLREAGPRQPARHLDPDGTC